MRPDLRSVPALLTALALAACADPQPAQPGGGGGGGGGPTTGAHPAHLSSGPYANAYACDTCHSASFQVTFPSPSLARANGASPAYDATAKTCSNVYCHAGGPQLPLAGGTLARPVFDPPSTLVCGGCHGIPPPAPHAQGSACGSCHPGYTSTTVDRSVHLNGVLDVSQSCTSCHGSASRAPTALNPQLPAAPPADTQGNTATSAAGVGAHQAHLNDGSLRRALACTECHVVPADAAHASQPLQLTWGPLATANGASPSFNAGTLTCSSTYCHGATLNAGGNLTVPVWNAGASQAACGTCHAGPPPAPHPQNASCGSCHPGYTATAVNLDTHVNGTVDVAAGSCTLCHGDATRAPTAANPQLPASPPVQPAGMPLAVVGTHQLHLNDNAIRQAVACASCHVVPADAAHAAGVAQPVQFGGLAVQNGASPTYAPGPAYTCSATYCHGNFNFGGVTGNAGATPAWDATPTLACTSCHAMPPAGHPAVPGTTAASCAGCHPQTVNANGTINVAGGLHIDGAANEGAHAAGWSDPAQHGRAANAQGLAACTSCHVGYGTAAGVAGSSCNACHGGTAWQSSCTFCHGTAGRTGNLAGTDPLLAAAPPVGSQGETATSQPAVGAHQAHVNPTTTSALAPPFGCAVCHPAPLPSDVTHVNGQPPAVTFGGVAVTGGITTAAYAGGSCSATYCHGNFPGGSNATPAWTGATLACTACHATAPQTGRHQLHMSRSSINCLMCHNGIATGTGNPSANAALVNATLHVNGTKNVVFGGTFLGGPVTGTWNGTSCAPSCHGGETW